MNFSMQAKCSDAKVTMTDDTKTMTQEASEHPMPPRPDCCCCRDLNETLKATNAILTRIADCLSHKPVDLGIKVD